MVRCEIDDNSGWMGQELAVEVKGKGWLYRELHLEWSTPGISFGTNAVY